MRRIKPIVYLNATRAAGIVKRVRRWTRCSTATTALTSREEALPSDSVQVYQEAAGCGAGASASAVTACQFGKRRAEAR